MLRTKTDAEGAIERFKARLVACGNEQIITSLLLPRSWNQALSRSFLFCGSLVSAREALGHKQENGYGDLLSYPQEMELPDRVTKDFFSVEYE